MHVQRCQPIQAHQLLNADSEARVMDKVMKSLDVCNLSEPNCFCNQNERISPHSQL